MNALRGGKLTVARITVETFTANNLEDFLALSHTEYGPSAATNVDHIKWKHVASPLGASTYICLVANDKTVGRALLQPRLICTESGQFSTACVTDVLIDPEFRSPPTNFINLTEASGSISAFSSVYHTSSNRTDLLYRKLFRFPKAFCLRGYGLPARLSGIFFKISGRRIDALDWLISPFRWLIGLAAVVGIAVARLDVSVRLPDDDMLSQIFLKSLRNCGPMFARSEAFIKWRLIDAPLLTATVYCAERSGKFLGYVAIRRIELNGLTFLIIVDFLLDPDLTLFDRLALRSWLILQAIQSDVDALFTMINPRSRAARICVGFPLIRIPDKLLRHRTPIFVRSRGNESRFLETEASMHMTLADLDYI